MAELDTAYTENFNTNNSEISFDITTIWNANKTNLTHLGFVYICLDNIKSFRYTVYEERNKSRSDIDTIVVNDLRPWPLCGIPQKHYMKGEVICRSEGNINYFSFPIKNPTKDYFVKIKVVQNAWNNIEKIPDTEKVSSPTTSSSELFGIFYTQKILKQREELDQNQSRNEAGHVAAYVHQNTPIYQPPFPKTMTCTKDFNNKQDVKILYNLAVIQRENEKKMKQHDLTNKTHDLVPKQSAVVEEKDEIYIDQLLQRVKDDKKIISDSDEEFVMLNKI